MTKEEIKNEVIIKLNSFIKSKLQSVTVNTEGSLEEDLQYLPLIDLKDALDLCFNETYKLTNKI